MVAQQVASRELEIFEIECGLPLLGGRVRGVEAVEQLLKVLAVAGGDCVQRRLLDSLAGLFVAGPALAADAEGGEIEQPVGGRLRVGG